MTNGIGAFWLMVAVLIWASCAIADIAQVAARAQRGRVSCERTLKHCADVMRQFFPSSPSLDRGPK